MKRTAYGQRGFTIVELLIVIVVIGILAAITVVSYNGITNRAKEVAIKSDLKTGATQLQVAFATSGEFPTDATGLKKSDDTNFTYTSTATGFCLAATSAAVPGKSYRVTNDGTIEEGICGIGSGSFIQTVTAANCPATRTMVVDARDNRTYWVQKLTTDTCWMLTNLAYAGGGTNTYNDVKTLQNGTADGAGTYTVAKYYIPTNANPTTSPSTPSTSTDGGATNPQYGYLYNWCAAMGAQATAACANATTPGLDSATSICPSGWRLPSSNTGGQLEVLNNTVNGGLTNTDAGLRTNWLSQLSGLWTNGSFSAQGTHGSYWSLTQRDAGNAYRAYALSGVSNPNNFSTKSVGFSARCVAI